MTLVRTLTGETLAADLQRAYVALVGVFLAHRGGGCATIEGADMVAIDSIVCATEKRVKLRETRKACDLIDTDEESPGELFDQLGHMYVLLQAIPLLREKCSLVPTICAPTQQSSHEGKRIADLEGQGWALEAYGGVRVTNNCKLAIDLKSLAGWRERVKRTFLAFRATAHSPVTSLKEGESRHLRDTCKKGKDAPYSAQATGTVIGCYNGVVILEASGITIADISGP